MWEVLVAEAVTSPEYATMELAYLDYQRESQPCRQTVRDPAGERRLQHSNQCAVRMSIALVRSGFLLTNFPAPRRVHSGTGTCDTNGRPHVLGATELADYLDSDLARSESFRQRGGGCAHVAALLNGRRGIVYFNNVFRRDDGTGGDHIDLFNGRNYFNDITPNLRANAGEMAAMRAGGSFFRRADAIRFWVL